MQAACVHSPNVVPVQSMHDDTLRTLETSIVVQSKQVPEKNGVEDVVAIVPLKPTSQVQPEPTSVPVESSGQLVAAQVPTLQAEHPKPWT